MLGCNPALTGQRYRNPDAALVLWLHYLVFSCIDNLVFTPRCAIFVLLFGGDARVVMCRVALAYSRFQPIAGLRPGYPNDCDEPNPSNGKRPCPGRSTLAQLTLTAALVQFRANCNDSLFANIAPPVSTQTGGQKN